jgi:hypothetical protein
MDEMKIALRTNFMKSALAKLICKVIAKQTGYKVGVNLRALDVSYDDGKVRMHTNVDMEMSSEEFTKLIKTIID